MRFLKLLVVALLVLMAVSASAQTVAISPHASKTMTYQYTSDTDGATLWIDFNAASGFIQYQGLTCVPISVWKVAQVYPLPTSTNRTQPKFSLTTSCTMAGLTYDVVEMGYAYWGGTGRVAGVYYFFENGTITKTMQ